MKRKIAAGTTSLMLKIFAQNSSLTTGAGLTGLSSATSGLTWYYLRNGANADVQVTLASATLGTYTSGGFIVVDATNMPGVYEIGVPNAAVASGVDTVHMMLQGAANMVPVLIEIELDAVNYQDAVHFGMSALPNTACTTNASLVTSGTGTDQISVSAGKVLLQATQSGVTIPTVTTVTNQLTAAAVATGVWQDTTSGDFTVGSSIGKSLFTGVTPGAAGGLFIAGTNAATTVTTSFTTTFTGNLTGSVGSVTGLSAAAFATAIWQDTTAGDFTVASSIGKALFVNAAPGAAGGLFIAGSNATTTVNITGNLSGAVGNVTGSVGSVTGAVGSVTGNVGGNVTGTVASVVGNVGGNVTGSVASVAGNVGGNVVGTVASVVGNVGGNVTGSVGSISGVTFPTNFGNMSIDTGGHVKLQGTIQKNTALVGFPFFMALSSDHYSPGTGKTISATVSLNGGAFGAMANAATEIANGWYTINLAASDTNGNTIAYSFAATGCDTTLITITTQP